jgi:hypothetical protein
MPETERYSHRFRFDAEGGINESIPESDAFYTLNCLLGLSSLADEGFGGHPPGHIRDVFIGCCREVSNPKVRIYMFGMALWAGARLGIEPPGELIDRVNALLADPAAVMRLKAQDVGMLISGATAMAVREGGRWRAVAHDLAMHLQKDYFHPRTHLFSNQASGLRRPFSSFASQVYSTLAFYQFAEAFDADWALECAKKATATIIAKQGPRGEWGWFYYVPGGLVVDYYEIYSVHQHGMAPAFLHHAVTHDVPGARAALVKGFEWLFGGNEMKISMLRPAERMFYRSQVRKGELSSISGRAWRSAVNMVLHRDDAVERHGELVLREECRSYELGWILWSFGGRNDYPELTQRAEFAVPGAQSAEGRAAAMATSAGLMSGG